MFSCIKTCTLEGLQGHIINVETDISRGMPKFSIVGLPDTAVKESTERAKSAVKNSGLEFPIAKILTNLAPAKPQFYPWKMPEGFNQKIKRKIYHPYSKELHHKYQPRFDVIEIYTEDEVINHFEDAFW